MPVHPTQFWVAAGFRLWPINGSETVGIPFPVESVEWSHLVPCTTFSTDPRMAVQ